MIIHRIKLLRAPLRQSLEALLSTPRFVSGMIIAHAGLGLVVAAITAVTSWQSENILAMSIGQRTEIAGYGIKLMDVRRSRGANFEAEVGHFAVFDGADQIDTLAAERRYFPVQRQQTSQTAIRTNIIANLYVALGESDSQGKWTVRLYHHPLAPFLWIGGITMALGGFVSLSDRRYRVGAPRTAPAYRAQLAGA